jgi:signal transduction histidine kinase
VKGIIEEHGGTIFVESVVDKGTTFWIRLPLDEAQDGGVKQQ